MKFIDLFSGVGGFTRGLELAGHQCIGHCEFDKFAEASYRSMHCITEEQREKLLSMPLKQRQKEILKDEYLNGEWYANDITTIKGTTVPSVDIWTFGAPCQDFSIAGRRAGLDGKRSSLVGEVFRCLEERQEEDRPEWLIYENVKGMLSSNNGRDYLTILTKMDELGYDIEWQNINSKWFVPQNRERIYTIGHLRRCGRREMLPIEGADGKNHICVEQVGRLSGRNRENPQVFRVYDTDGLAPSLNTMQGGHREPCILEKRFCDLSKGSLKITDISRCNGRRCKEDGEPLTAQDRHGVAIRVREATQKGYAVAEMGDAINIAVPTSKTRRGRVDKQIAQTLDTSCNQGVFVTLKDGSSIYATWYEKEQCYIAIRKLTPRECFRLQGWTDDYFDKAEQFNSNAQLYKQAGNGVTVNVVQAIGEKL